MFAYPYRDNDPVDAVMTLTTGGAVSANTAANLGKGFLLGATFGLLSPAIGPSITAHSQVKAVFTVGNEEIGVYEAQATTSSEFGLFADGTEVARKTAEVQKKTLANELAKKIRGDRQALLSKLRRK